MKKTYIFIIAGIVLIMALNFGTNLFKGNNLLDESSYKPAMGDEYFATYEGSDTTLNHNTETYITFSNNADEHDPLNMHTNGDSKVYALTGGLYEVYAKAIIFANNPGVTIASYLYLLKNGEATGSPRDYDFQQWDPSAGNSLRSYVIHRFIKLNAGDYLQLKALQINANSNNGTARNINFIMKKVGDAE